MPTMPRTIALILLGGALLGPSLAAAQTVPRADHNADGLSTLRFQNLSVSVANLARASAWYQDVLGFKQVRSGEFPSVGAKFIFLEGNGMQLELISAGKSTMPETATNPPDHLKTIGYKTLVFNTVDLSAATAELERKGVQFVWKAQKLTDDLSSTMLHDGEGNLINIFGPVTRR